MVIPGAVSLGAYEAGALTALFRLIDASRGRIVLDTIVGASAGSVTGAILAHALLTGRGADALEDLWVRQASIQNLLAGRTLPGRPRAPLSTQVLERWARAHLTGEGIGPDAEPIVMVVSIANLRGLRYRIAQPESARTIPADTFRDARAFLLGPDTAWSLVTEAAIASAANAFAFAPVRIQRRREEYPANVELPQDVFDAWYTDGGTVYNVPLGYALDAVYDPDAIGLPPRWFREPRVFLLLNPHPTSPPERWPASAEPTFVRTAGRASSLSRQQSLFDDLRRAEKTNSRVLARFQLQARLGTLLPDDERLGSAIRDMAAWAWARKRTIRGLLGRDPGPDTIEEELARRGAPSSVDALLDFVLDESTETRGKDAAPIEIVSPDVEAGEVPVGDLLAGERLLHFFGFFLQAARESDFGLGYRNLRAWWRSFARDSDIEIPPHRLEEAPPGGLLSIRDVRPAWYRWWLTLRIAARYARELLSR